MYTGQYRSRAKEVNHYLYTAIIKITNLLDSTVARNSINVNVVGHTGYCGYMHDVTMTLCAPSIINVH